MTDLLQPDLFGQLPPEPVDIDALRAEYASEAARGARANSRSEQEARDQKIYAGREEDLSGEAKGPSIAPTSYELAAPEATTIEVPQPAKPEGHDVFEPLTQPSKELGLPIVRALRKTLIR